MNTFLIDVTDIPSVHSADEVTLFGKQGSAEISKTEVKEIRGGLFADLYTVWGNSNNKILVEEKVAKK